MLRSTPVALWIVLCSVAPAIGHAKLSGKAVLEKMDAALTRSRDQDITFEMVINGDKKVGLRVRTRDEKRRVDFLYPGNIKGMRVLILSRAQMYVYVPAYRKIRRIASHVKAQSMFDADYNYDDMSTVRYSGVFSPRLVDESKTHWTLAATRRAGQDSPYSKLRLRVRKADQLPDLIYYFDDKGRKIKTETRSAFSCQKSMCGAAKMRIVDHTRGGHWTELHRKKWAVDSDFSDRVFSLRRLHRGL